jgi:hypothetical protein
MKNLIIASFLGIALLFSACGKYEEGPKLSLMSKKARVAGEWKIDKVTVNGTEVTLDETTKSMVMTLEKDGTGKTKVTWGGLTVESELEWKFNDDKTKLMSRGKDLNGNWDTEWSESEIMQLKNKEMMLKDVDTTGGVTTTSITYLIAN